MTAISFQDLDRPLRPREQKILNFIRRFWREQHHSPSYREIEVGIGRPGHVTGGIPYNLAQLEELGHLRLVRGRGGRLRAIVPVGPECPCCGKTGGTL